MTGPIAITVEGSLKASRLRRSRSCRARTRGHASTFIADRRRPSRRSRRDDPRDRRHEHAHDPRPRPRRQRVPRRDAERELRRAPGRHRRRVPNVGCGRRRGRRNRAESAAAADSRRRKSRSRPARRSRSSSARAAVPGAFATSAWSGGIGGGYSAVVSRHDAARDRGRWWRRRRDRLRFGDGRWQRAGSRGWRRRRLVGRELASASVRRRRCDRRRRRQRGLVPRRLAARPSTAARARP